MNNQGAFDIALLHLLNQAHRAMSSTGRSKLRGSQGARSAIGALIPDRMYWNSMEGKTVQQLLVATGPGYDSLRERLSGVAPQLLNELQDLHDRAGDCLPSLFREIILAGGQRIARMFGLSMRMVHLWTAYRKLSGPRVSQRIEPVVLESLVRGSSRYSADIGAAAVT